MPFLPIETEIDGLRLGAWRIEEDELFFLTQLKLYDSEWTTLSQITHPHKRLEWLSSRLCMKHILNIGHKDRIQSLSASSGKPYLSDGSHRISYTHSHLYAAAIASSVHEVGIDIEYLLKRRNIRTRFLFMNPDELAFYEKHNCFEAFILVWSAKETIYKTFGQAGLSFKNHIHLDLNETELKSHGSVTAKIEYPGRSCQYNIFYRFFPEFLLTYTSVLPGKAKRQKIHKYEKIPVLN